MMQEYIKVSHSGVATGKECKSYTWSPFVHLPWLACCGRWNFLRDTGGVHQIRTVFTICLCIYLYFRCKVNSALIQLCTQKSYSHNRKENSRRFPPEITPLFLLTTLYTTTLVLPAYLTAGIHHPIPLFAANHFPRLNLSLTPPTNHQWFLECTLVV